jgi:hypothetical protein
MGKRSRKRRSTGGGAAMQRGYARSEQRNEEIRRRLEPVAPGERPGAVTVAAVLALALAAANLGLALAGVEVGDERPPLTGTLLFTALMVAAGVGMWKAKYWAVLGFQALLVLTIVIAALSLSVASNAIAFAVPVVIVLLGGWLFWKLVRALARLQMPAR